jgi:hypothetical protein
MKKKLLEQKVVQNVTLFGYFIFSQNHNGSPKSCPIWRKLTNLVTLLMLFPSLVKFSFHS